MAANDYLPSGDVELRAWLSTFKDALAAAGAALGFSQAEIDEAAADHALYDAKVAAVQAAKNAQQSAVADKNSTRTAIKQRARAKAQRAKSAAAYTEAIGQQLGVIGPEDTTELETSKPTLKVEAVMPGSVTIGFNKSTSDGVMIYGKVGAQTTFSMLAWDTRSPYVDNRPNAAPGPEMREYRAQYFKDDEPIGQFSDIVQVTVPG